MKTFFAFFRRLQWKMTLSYALVTMGTVIVLAALLIGFALFLESYNSTHLSDSIYWSKTAFQDNIPYLVEDPAALQAWLNRVHQDGFQESDFRSATVRETLDSANTVVRSAPFYVLDLELNLLAASPLDDPAAIGRPFQPRELAGRNLDAIFEAALTGNKNYFAQSLLLPDGSYLSAFPLRKSDDDPVAAIVVYQFRPFKIATPSNLELYSAFFAATMVIMVLVSLPVGAIFGWMVSNGLRRRLANLSTAARAWSKGDFSLAPRDRSGDEIGELTRNLNLMAEQLQTLLQTRDELARVEERNRLARDLHDTVKQQTYAARMQLSAAKNLLAGSSGAASSSGAADNSGAGGNSNANTNLSAAAEHIESALQLNRETQQELKLIIDKLRPAALEGRGLAQAISDYTARWQEHTGIAVQTAIRGERYLPLQVEQALYRVLQESLSNVARHAEAEAVAITLSMAPDRVTLTIADNGRGFEPAAVAPSSLGLTGMHQRLKEVGGTLSVESTLSVGTKVIAEVGT